MSIHALNWAFQQDGLTSTQKLTLITLANYADDGGFCWPKQSTLAKVVGISRQRMWEILNKELPELGLIDHERYYVNGEEVSCVYALGCGWDKHYEPEASKREIPERILYRFYTGVLPTGQGVSSPPDTPVSNAPDTEPSVRTTTRTSNSPNLRSDILVPTDTGIKPNRFNYSPEFESFWQSYPGKTNNSKINAYKEWNRLSPEDRALAVKGVPNFAAYCRKNKDYPVLHCERYLKYRRFDTWAAEPSPAAVQYFRV